MCKVTVLHIRVNGCLQWTQIKCWIGCHAFPALNVPSTSSWVKSQWLLKSASVFYIFNEFFHSWSSISKKMFVVIFLECSYEHIVVPLDWIHQVFLQPHTIDGVNSGERHKVFYSPDPRKTANFKLPTEERFYRNNDGCYWARLYKYFGKFFS